MTDADHYRRRRSSRKTMKSIFTAFAIVASRPGRAAASSWRTSAPRGRGGGALASASFVPHRPSPLAARLRRSAAAVASRGLPANPQDSTVAVVDEMPAALPPLKNYYYLLRHGQSTANVAGIISSARSLAGSAEHGLTLLGMRQGEDSAGPLLELVSEDVDGDGTDGVPKSSKRLYFYSSPFARAKETAEACLRGIAGNDEVAEKARTLGLEVHGDIALDDGLMERFFGRLDGAALSTYAYVWPVDMFQPTHTAFDVESVAAVSTRIRETLLCIDSRHVDDGGGNHIVLTSHADVLQITQVYAAGHENCGKFSQYRFGNGEVRRMGRGVDTLPEPVPLQPPKRGE